jgi:hypothetical protein
MTAAFFVHWLTRNALNHTGIILLISCTPTSIIRRPSAGNYRPNLNLKTILSVSVAIEPDILDTPARRSVKVIGISRNLNPACAIL